MNTNSIESISTDALVSVTGGTYREGQQMVRDGYAAMAQGRRDAAASARAANEAQWNETLASDRSTASNWGATAGAWLGDKLGAAVGFVRGAFTGAAAGRAAYDAELNR